MAHGRRAEDVPRHFAADLLAAVSTGLLGGPFPLDNYTRSECQPHTFG